MSLPGVITGVLGLAFLEVVTSSPAASNRLGDVATLGSSLVGRLVSPKIGLIPNLDDTSAPAAGSSATTPSTAPAGGSSSSSPDDGLFNQLTHPTKLIHTGQVTRSPRPLKGRKPEVAPIKGGH